ncbi:rabphilin-3A-like [Panthera pardus]|uniref:Rabphilin-3A-like n=1 Tax=Panthera pardus TaxID=9691 RepID=A0A9W2VZ52_PANPR|nr:rabphilin-3A-like [Panthera pardus]
MQVLGPEVSGAVAAGWPHPSPAQPQNRGRRGHPETRRRAAGPSRGRRGPGSRRSADHRWRHEAAVGPPRRLPRPRVSAVLGPAWPSPPPSARRSAETPGILLSIRWAQRKLLISQRRPGGEAPKAASPVPTTEDSKGGMIQAWPIRVPHPGAVVGSEMGM